VNYNIDIEMNIVEKYYMRKASMGNNDEYYTAIE